MSFSNNVLPHSGGSFSPTDVMSSTTVLSFPILCPVIGEEYLYHVVVPNLQGDSLKCYDIVPCFTCRKFPFCETSSAC